jgi:hypothetical protein
LLKGWCCVVRNASVSPKVRVSLWVAICGFVLLLPAWSTASPPPGPPRCSAADTRHNAILRANGYQRFCGPARAVVYLNGKTYRVQGGFCLPRQSTLEKARRRFGGISIGFFPAKAGLPPGRGVDFWWLPPSTRAQATTIDDSEIEVPGTAVAASGIVVVGKKLKGGWFSLYGRDGSGPTGPLVSGSWTCN